MLFWAFNCYVNDTLSLFPLQCWDLTKMSYDVESTFNITEYLKLLECPNLGKSCWDFHENKKYKQNSCELLVLALLLILFVVLTSFAVSQTSNPTSHSWFGSQNNNCSSMCIYFSFPFYLFIHLRWSKMLLVHIQPLEFLF